ncbi:hypothetical protein C8R43DRAFT_1137998 [Mycena crocata]|nr:hypothetical protein C8R43DRAFT_1137998 [Mycena crocata]
MPRTSNTKKARQENARKATESRKVHMEEVPDEGDPPAAQTPPSVPVGHDHTHSHHHDGSHSHHPHNSNPGEGEHDWDFDLGNELPDIDCEQFFPEEEPDLDEEIVMAPEISDETSLDAFSTFLRDAQTAAQEAERAREKERKRPRKYFGNAPRTKRRHIERGKELKKQGFLGIQDFLKAKKAEKEKEKELIIISEDSASEHSDIESPDEWVDDQPSVSPELNQSPPVMPPGPSQPNLSDCMDPVNLAQVRLRELLESAGGISDPTPESASDGALNQLNYKNFPALRRAVASLTLKSKDKNLDVFFRARITAMVGTINLYLDSELSYSWRQASMIVAKAQGHGPYHARSIRTWIHTYLTTKRLPLHRYGQYHSSILNDEDFAGSIKLYLQSISEKKGHFTAQTLVDYVASPDIQEKLAEANVTKRSISVWTARRWLKKLDWRYGRRRNGMYIDGHEREDVVEYRAAFVKRWMEQYEPRMVTYDNDGNPIKYPDHYALEGKYKDQHFRLILVTHDESTFYANDRREVGWLHKSDKGKPQPKGEGQSIMISDFLTLDWGRLKDEEDEARLLFRAGKNRDGWFNSEHLLKQVELAIDIFEANHRKRAADALSALKLVKNPKLLEGVRMRNGTMPNGESQSFYHPDNHPTMPGWFKGMEQIIRERGLWPEGGLLAQCPGFKCEAGKTDCCCRRVLFSQPDFVNQKSALEELVESRGHICDFYPKYHCELNFIEMYWGAAKFRYRTTGRTSNIEEMEKNVISCLDDVPRLSMIRFANRAARFISAYAQGLTGGDLIWIKKKYRSHRILPPSMIAEIKASIVV